MNIVFLDIDGVLLPFGSYDDWYLAEAMREPEKFLSDVAKRVPAVIVSNIKQFCEDNDAEIVLISTWRYLFEENVLWNFFYELGLASYLYDGGPDDGTWIARTPNAFRNDKFSDVTHWLEARPSVNYWWLIDDEYQGVDNKHWIKTNPYKGYVNVDDDFCE